MTVTIGYFDRAPSGLPCGCDPHFRTTSRTKINTMSALLHGPNPGSDNEPPENPVIQARNARLGLRLFAVYGLIYALYVVAGAFLPSVMRAGLAGVNVAVVWGFGLIILAFVMAIVYGRLCDRPLSGTEEQGAQR
jgi:uncharacterized membrane protein (DUF485 family)